MGVLKDIEGKTAINLKDAKGNIEIKEIKFDFEAICFIEEETNMQFLEFAGKLSKSKTIFKDLRLLITAGMQHEKEYTEKQMAKKMISMEIGNYTTAVMESVKKHLAPAN